MSRSDALKTPAKSNPKARIVVAVPRDVETRLQGRRKRKRSLDDKQHVPIQHAVVDLTPHQPSLQALASVSKVSTTTDDHPLPPATPAPPQGVDVDDSITWSQRPKPFTIHRRGPLPQTPEFWTDVLITGAARRSVNVDFQLLCLRLQQLRQLNHVPVPVLWPAGTTELLERMVRVRPGRLHLDLDTNEALILRRHEALTVSEPLEHSGHGPGAVVSDGVRTMFRRELGLPQKEKARLVIYDPDSVTGKARCHWDHLLEEMAWLRKDFRGERRLKLDRCWRLAGWARWAWKRWRGKRGGRLVAGSTTTEVVEHVEGGREDEAAEGVMGGYGCDLKLGFWCDRVFEGLDERGETVNCRVTRFLGYKRELVEGDHGFVSDEHGRLLSSVGGESDAETLAYGAGNSAPVGVVNAHDQVREIEEDEKPKRTTFRDVSFETPEPEGFLDINDLMGPLRPSTV